MRRASLGHAHRNLRHHFAERPRPSDAADQESQRPVTPTSCSWLNAVEGFFAKLSKRRLKRGVFHSVVDLRAAVKRGHQALDSIHSINDA